MRSRHGLPYLVPMAAAAVLGGLLSAAVASCSDESPVPVAHAAAPKTAPQHVINLTHGTDDLHAVTMALLLGQRMAERGGDVTLFLNLEGVRLADQRQPLDLAWGRGDRQSVSEMYTGFTKAGGKVVVCPHCAMAAGLPQSELREGASIGTDTGVADLMIAADNILDY